MKYLSVTVVLMSLFLLKACSKKETQNDINNPASYIDPDGVLAAKSMSGNDTVALLGTSSGGTLKVATISWPRLNSTEGTLKREDDRWSLVNVSPGVFRIRHIHSGKFLFYKVVLALDLNGQYYNKKTLGYTTRTSDSTLFKVVRSGSDIKRFTLETVIAPGYYLTIQNPFINGGYFSQVEFKTAKQEFFMLAW